MLRNFLVIFVIIMEAFSSIKHPSFSADLNLSYINGSPQDLLDSICQSERVVTSMGTRTFAAPLPNR